MKLIRLITLIAACLFAMAALAQQTPPAQESGEQKHGGHMGPGMMGSVDDHVKEISTKLNLTADQQAKVKTILQENHEQMEALMKDDSVSKEDKHAKMKGMHDSVHAKVREVLTDEQKPKFDAMVKDMETNMHSQHDHDKDHK
jgi:Spy/CpxP family protein refolding chaperone